MFSVCFLEKGSKRKSPCISRLGRVVPLLYKDKNFYCVKVGSFLLGEKKKHSIYNFFSTLHLGTFLFDLEVKGIHSSKTFIHRKIICSGFRIPMIFSQM